MLVITTCNTYPEAPASLLPLQYELQQRGLSVQFAPWQTCPAAPLILPLCAWDYAAEARQFRAWLRQAPACGSRFINTPALMRWNMDKRYLCDLAAQGANVIPTYRLSADREAVRRLVRAQHWPQTVVKPAIGQSGHGVIRFDGDNVPPLPPASNGLVVQPFCSETTQYGETCLIFFQGTFSHAVVRRPAVGEWRANSGFGAEVVAVQPDPAVIRAARRILDMLPEQPVYARIDGVACGGTLLLNEVELIEPALYLHLAAGSSARLADVLCAVAA